MPRYPPIRPADLSPEQESAHSEANSMVDRFFQDKFITKDEHGALVGPFAVLLRTPALMHTFLSLNSDITKISGVSPEVRETTIIATGSVFKAAYELYAHTTLAAKGTKLSNNQISSIKDGKKPQGKDQLDAACEVAFDMAMELSSRPGPLSESTWKRSCDTVGKDATLGLIHLVGIYAYTCIVLNGADVPVPE